MTSKLEVLVKTAGSVGVPQGRELEAFVDEDIKEFDSYFQGLGNDPLVRSEAAIIKTYLHWKLKGERDGAATGG